MINTPHGAVCTRNMYSCGAWTKSKFIGHMSVEWSW